MIGCDDAPDFMADYIQYDFVCVIKNAINDALGVDSEFKLDWTMTAVLLGAGFMGLMLLMTSDSDRGRIMIIR